MLKIKSPLILAGLITAWPVLCFGFSDPNKWTDPNMFDLSNNDNGMVGTLFKSVLMIIVLGGVAVYLSRKFMPKIRPTSGRDISIRETIHLGPQKTVHIIEVGSKRFLVGSSSESINMLADVTENLED